jgi:hypothetical protein
MSLRFLYLARAAVCLCALVSLGCGRWFYDSQSGTELDASLDAPPDAMLAQAYRKEIVVDRGAVGCAEESPPATLSNYPLLVSITDANLRTRASDPADGRVENANGYDIGFRALDAATCNGPPPCVLDHQLEEYDGASGRLVAWVRLPSINTLVAGVDTEIYMYYGDAAINASTENAASVFDLSYVGVYHLGENPGAGSMDDSTASSHDGVPEGSMTGDDQVPGRVANGLDFDGLDDGVNIGSPTTLDDLGPLTVSAWINPRTSGGGSRAYVVGKSEDSIADDGRWLFYVSDLAQVLTLKFTKEGASDLELQSTDSVVALGTWQHVAVTWDGTEPDFSGQIYKDGAEVDYQLSTNGQTFNSDSAMELFIGNRGNGERAFDGIIDEVRISNVVRSCHELRTDFANQSNPGSVGAPGFYIVGAEETVP